MNVRFDHANKRRDERGFLVDFLKGDELDRQRKKLGQIYFVTFEKANVIRGNHYHARKNEWFVVVKGKIRVVMEQVKSHKRHIRELNGDDDAYERIFIGSNIAHAFINITKNAMMINYSDVPYRTDDPDTFPYIVISPS